MHYCYFKKRIVWEHHSGKIVWFVRNVKKSTTAVKLLSAQGLQNLTCSKTHFTKHSGDLQVLSAHCTTFFDFWMIICLVLIIFQYPLDLTYCWIKISIPFTNNHATGNYNDTNFLCLWNLYSNINKQSIKSWSYRLLHEGFFHNAVNYLHTFMVKQSR